jgi:hypothetical protein
MDVACPRCGRLSPSDHTFCGYCGVSLGLAQTEMAPANAGNSGMEGPPASVDREFASLLTLLRLRHIVGAIQGIMLLAACPLLLLSVDSGWWALGVFLILCVIQLLISLAIRKRGGRGAIEAVSEIERQGPFR